jgi:hypothetical protein
VKNTFRTLPLLSLGSFALLLAASTPAQNPARVTSVDQIINGNRPQKPSSDASYNANKTLSPHEQTAMPDATESCSYKFTSGSGATYMNYCITVNGNFVNFQSPAGVEMLDQQSTTPSRAEAAINFFASLVVFCLPFTISSVEWELSQFPIRRRGLFQGGLRDCRG